MCFSNQSSNHNNINGSQFAFKFFQVVITCLLASCFVETDGIILGKEEEDILIKVIEEFKLNPTHWIYNSPFTPDKEKACISKIFLWCPLQHYQTTVLCPIHKCPLEFHSWTTKLTHQSPRNPRLVYDLQGNILLVQSIYRCKRNLAELKLPGHEYYSASADILNIIPITIKEKFPIKLLYRSACSQGLLDYVFTHIGRGQNFLELSEDIGSMNFKAFIRNNRGSISSSAFYDSIIYSYPSNDQLMHIFLSYFNEMEHAYQKQMELVPCSILTCDHTFKVSKQVGVVRNSDDVFVHQFENLFIALNEHGQVVAWRLTRSTAFKEVEDLLNDFKKLLDAKGQQLDMIMVDDCCSSRPSYRKVFPSVPVKLDLFHACQRFVRTVPKGSCQSQQLSNEFGLIFRANDDVGQSRTMETPDAESIEANLQMFVQKWEHCLSDESKNAIDHIKKHIQSGCCSGIPPGVGTQKNERLHRQLKRSLLGGAATVSPELAIAVLTVFLYVWNCKVQPDQRKHRSNVRVVPVVPIEIHQNDRMPDNFHESLTKKFKSAGVSRDVPLAMAMEKNNSSILLPSSQKEFGIDVHSGRLEDLKRDTLVNYTLSRVLHLHEVFTSVEKKCTSRAFDIFNFPFSDIKRMVQVIHSQSCNTFTASQGNNISAKVLSTEMNNDCLQRHLSAFGLALHRIPGNGDCCFASIVTELHKILSLVSNDDGDDGLACHLKSIGLGSSIETDTLQLRLLFCQEIEKNMEKYSSFVDFNVNDELTTFAKSGWFNSSLGDLCVCACSNLLKIPIVVITSIPGSPVLTFVPSTLLTTRSIYVAYNHSPPGHYDATRAIDDLHLSGKQGPGQNKVLCNCGLYLKQKGGEVLGSCESLRCSCAKSGNKCSRECRCINCKNCPLVEMTASNDLATGCSCGLTKKQDPTFTACKDLKRKSKCPCLRQGVYCSKYCKCFNCGNRHENQKLSDSSTAVGCRSESRKRPNPDPYKRTKGAKFLAEGGFDLTPGPWTSLETVTLFVIIEVLTTCSIQVNSKNVADLYNFVACSSNAKEMSLPISYKAFPKVAAKLAFVNSKHAVVESLIDSLVKNSK